jgi:hypothetical protein
MNVTTLAIGTGDRIGTPLTVRGRNRAAFSASMAAA